MVGRSGGGRGCADDAPPSFPPLFEPTARLDLSLLLKASLSLGYSLVLSCFLKQFSCLTRVDLKLLLLFGSDEMHFKGQRFGPPATGRVARSPVETTYICNCAETLRT